AKCTANRRRSATNDRTTPAPNAIARSISVNNGHQSAVPVHGSRKERGYPERQEDQLANQPGERCEQTEMPALGQNEQAIYRTPQPSGGHCTRHWCERPAGASHRTGQAGDRRAEQRLAKESRRYVFASATQPATMASPDLDEAQPAHGLVDRPIAQ